MVGFLFLITLLLMQSLKSMYFNCYDVELAVFTFSDLDSGVGPWIRIQAYGNGPQEKGEK